MSDGAPTIGGLQRLGDYLAGQEYWDVNITGGDIANVTLTGVSFTGTSIVGITGTKAQFNSACTDGDFVFTGDNLTTTTVTANTSGGIVLESNSGADCLLLGAGGGANATAYGGWNFDAATANTIASFGASKTLTALPTVTYPNLTELSYVKGVTSAVQTQLDSKISTGGTPTFDTLNLTGSTNQIVLDSDSANTGTISMSALTVNRVWTFPNASGTFTLGGNSFSGTGNIVRETSPTISTPTLVTPALGTPSSGTLTNCTGLPIAAGTTGTLAETRGGTNQTTYTQGDILYASGANTLAKLPKGTALQQLRMNAGATAPEWATTTTSEPKVYAAVNFTGITTASIVKSYNITSVSRTGTGAYTVTMTSAAPDANYYVSLTSKVNGGNGDIAVNTTGNTTTQIYITSGVFNTSAGDVTNVYMLVHV